jgi:hypothetical protein
MEEKLANKILTSQVSVRDLCQLLGIAYWSGIEKTNKFHDGHINLMHAAYTFFVKKGDLDPREIYNLTVGKYAKLIENEHADLGCDGDSVFYYDVDSFKGEWVYYKVL